MSDEETTQPAEQPKEEEAIEVQGAGFIPGVAGQFANCRVVLDRETRQVLRIEPLEGTSAFLVASIPAEPVSEPVVPAQQVEQAAEQPQQESQGG